MKRIMQVLIVGLVTVGLLTAAQPLLAKKKGNVPPGQAKKQGSAAVTHGSHEAAPEEAPPGWSRGEKTGWHGSKYPPGWSKWDKRKRKRWNDDRDSADRDIREISIKYGIPREKQDEITEAFGQAIAGGLIINDAKNKLVKAIQDEKSRRDLMINTTQSILDLLMK